MDSTYRIPSKECIELYETIGKNNDYPSYPAIECDNLSLIGRDGNMWTSIKGKWVLSTLNNDKQIYPSIYKNI